MKDNKIGPDASIAKGMGVEPLQVAFQRERFAEDLRNLTLTSMRATLEKLQDQEHCSAWDFKRFLLEAMDLAAAKAMAEIAKTQLPVTGGDEKRPEWPTLDQNKQMIRGGMSSTAIEAVRTLAQLATLQEELANPKTQRREHLLEVDVMSEMVRQLKEANADWKFDPSKITTLIQEGAERAVLENLGLNPANYGLQSVPQASA